MHKKTVSRLILMVSLIALVAVFFIKPIPQDLAYHDFVDQRGFFNVPNFWNVLSNLPFLFIGGLGLVKLNKLKIIEDMGVAYWLFFFAVALVAFGSGYYHLNPSNDTLVWDRLPMTIAFMSLFAIIISEFVNERRGSLLLVPLLIIGIASVFYWQWTEYHGSGDLRFYALVQFLPILIIPLILLLYPARFSHVTGYWWLLLFYVLAKILEYFDGQVYTLSNALISGHSIKHMVAALAVYFLYLSYKKRKELSH